MIYYGCCVGDQDKLTKWALPSVRGGPLICTYHQASIVTAYNDILDALSHRLTADDVLVLLHDDLEITDPGFDAKLAAAFAEPGVGLVGVAGGGQPGKPCPELFWWGHTPVGHQRTDMRVIDFGPRAGEVAMVEGSLMAFAGWVMRDVAFDSRFDGCDFHGYDEIAAQVIAAGARVWVADIDTWHHNPEGYRSPASGEAAARANQRYRDKWGIV